MNLTVVSCAVESARAVLRTRCALQQNSVHPTFSTPSHDRTDWRRRRDLDPVNRFLPNHPQSAFLIQSLCFSRRNMEPEILPVAPSPHRSDVFFNQRGLRAGWRIAIYLPMVIAFLIFLQLLLTVATSKLNLPSPTKGVLTPGIQIVAEMLAFLLLILAAFIMSRIERQNMANYGLPLHGEPVVRRFWAGYFFWGFLPLTICLFVIYLFHGYSFGTLALHGADIARFAVEWGIGFLLVGLFEE